MHILRGAFVSTGHPPLLASTGPFYMFSLDETFELIAEAGFDGAELMITQDRISQDPLRLEAIASRYELPVPAIHGPFLLATSLVFGLDPRGKIARSVEFAERIGAATVVIHPPYRWQGGYAAWLDERIAEVFEETGIRVTVENMFPVWPRGQRLQFHNGVTPAEMRRYPWVTLDLSHLAVSGVDLDQAWDELADRVVHVHVSNNAGDGRDSHAPLDKGVLRVDRFLERLGSSGFAGAVTLELDVRPWADNRLALLEVLRENRELASRHLGQAGSEASHGRARVRARRAG
jgi:sugar phosphate isomerase/epimerase